MDRDKYPKIMIRCDDEGTVTEVQGEDFVWLPHTGDSLIRWVDLPGRRGLRLLLDSVLKDGAALDRSIDIDSSVGASHLFFSGCRTISGMIFLGHAKSHAVAQLSDELMSLAYKEPAEVGKARSHSGSRGDYDPVAYLSNELLRAQLEVVKKNLELETQRVELRKELGRIVHGLRNPASGILSASEYLIEDSSLPDGHMKLLQGVARSSSSILRMIDDLLAVAALKSGNSGMGLWPTDRRSIGEKARSAP